MRGRVGLVYIEQPVSDENRSFGIALDEMWGIGAGIARSYDSGELELNVNVVDTGEAPIDTGFDENNGRVVGETEDHYAVLFDFSWHWK